MASTDAGYNADAAPAAPFAEKTKEELAAMSKEERTAYHKAKLAVAKAAANPAATMSKAEKSKLAREKQEADRKKKEDAKNEAEQGKEELEELKLQGLTEEQAKQVLAEMKAEQVAKDAGDDSDDDDEETLLDSVRRWMAEQDGDKIGADAIPDFNLKVRFQGHVDSTPPDHFGSILEVIASNVIGAMDLAQAKQPGAISKQAGPVVEKWSEMLDALLKKVDIIESGDIIVNSLRSGVTSAGGEAAADMAKTDCAVVGLIMAVHEHLDDVDDETLLAACKKIESDSKVWKGYISHLEECVEGSDEDSDGD